MRIQPNQILFDQPILKIREVIRYAMTGRLSGIEKNEIIKEIATVLGGTIKDAKLLFKKLINEEYLIFEKKKIGNNLYHEVTETEKGRRLGVTRANPPITRAKADLLLTELLERVEKINSNADLVYKVENVKVFGSYLSNQKILGDIDVAIKLEKKVSGDELISKTEERLQLAHKNGRTFSSFIDKLYWPRQEVILQLSTRKKGLSLHYDGEDEVLNRTESKVVFQL
jgi:predicted nucleotidyltransferase